MPVNPHLSDTSANAAAAAVTALASGGSLVIYNGTQPANANTALSGQSVMITFLLPNPAFATPTGGVAVAHTIPAATTTGTGTATWFRVYKPDGTTVLWDGAVAVTGADLNLNSVTIAPGISATISAYSYGQAE